MRLGTPSFSMFCSASGNAASEEAVVNAMSHGSFVACQNRRRGTLKAIATGSNTKSTKTMSAP